MIESILLQQAPSFWQQASWIAGTLGVVVAAIALLISAVANRRNAIAQKDSAVANQETATARRATFWLDLRRMFTSHDKVHRKLRPNGEWTKAGKEMEPAVGTYDEAALISYMGLFEHCEFMLQDKLIDEETFKRIYAYRLNPLLSNNRVRQKLAEYDPQGRFVKHKNWEQDDTGGWSAFYSLLKRCNKLDRLEKPLRGQSPSVPPT